MSNSSAQKHRRRISVAVAALAGIAMCVSFSPLHAKRESANAAKGAAKNSQSTSTAMKQRALANYAALPVLFEANEGQASSEVRYLARGKGYSLYLTSTGATMKVRRGNVDSEVLSMMRNRRLGPAKTMRMLQERQHNAEANHSLSASVQMQMVDANPKAQLVASQQESGKVNYMVGRDRTKWHSNIPVYGRVEYKQVYHGVDVAFHGAGSQLEFDYLVSPNADPNQIALQFDGAEKVRTTAEGNLVLSTAAGDVQLLKPVAYQEDGSSRKLVDAGLAVKGNRVSFRLGEYDRSRRLVIDPTVIYSTYFGGSLVDYGTGIAVDSSGNEYVAGTTDSATLPVNATGSASGTFDAFVTQISSSGAWQFTTVFGGATGDDVPGGIAVDSQAFYVAGTTSSQDFPVTTGAAQTTFQGGTATGSNDAFAVSFSLDGTTENWGTYIGGNDSDSGLGVAVDSSHNVYVVGETFSTNLPVVNPLVSGTKLNLGQSTTNPTDDGYIAVVNSAGSSFNMVSYIGGSGPDTATGVALDGSGNVYICGATASSDLPVTSGVVQGSIKSAGNDDAFVIAITASSFTAAKAQRGLRAPASTDAAPSRRILSALWLAIPGLAIVSICINCGSSQRRFLELLLMMAAISLFPSCGGGSSSVGGGSACTTAPSAATGLAASGTTNSGTNLGWNAVTPPANCTISSYTVLQNGTAIGTATGTSFAVSGLAASTSYSFTVEATDSNGTSGPSSAVNVTTLANSCTTKPNAPNGLAASGTTNSGTNLSWSTDTPPANCTISNYTVLQNGSSIGTATATSFAVSGLAASTSYSFTVEATDAAGTSSASSPVNVTTQSGNNASLIYSTYFGGSAGDDALGIASDSSGDVFVVGETQSNDFPLSSTTFQGKLNGTQNAFLFELNPTGTSATYSTYLGGSGSDTALGVTVDSDIVYMTGQTSSADFPITTNAIQGTFGGSTDAFVTVIDPSTNGLVFSDFLGGSGDENQGFASIALDSLKNVYVTGDTDSGNGTTTTFPVSPGAIQSTWSSGGTCQNGQGTTVPCPDAFITAYTTP